MAYETKPTVFKWASSGIGVIAMNSTKQALGWVAEMMTFQNLNWLFREITQHLKHLNERGVGDWDAATSYDTGALVMYATDNEVYRCIQDANVNKDPGTQPAWWVKLTAHTTNAIPAATESVAGKAEIATTAEAQTYTNDVAVLTALKLANALKGGNQSLAANGYQKLPGGLIIQWGTFTEDPNPLSLPIAFPTAMRAIFATQKGAVGSTASACIVEINSTQTFTLNIGAAGGTTLQAFVVAIGD